ncbi:hypothetical protein K9N68_30925 [Kovacikia minuta CCNUW1]|uniref:hypothetical protein n=1 Tax=Kovacikia minuta TaxID=2931930 RepID=UPI001CCF8559|nr:hypothetical protein [Kovacikia minuta]UBF25905.1 hypothetical protein K9N68_30925 [Kovacikia minuta CCNUW1]
MLGESNLIQTIFRRGRISSLLPSNRFKRWHRRIVPSGLVVLLGLTGGWLVGQAIAPALVQAYTSRVDVALDVQPGESYEALLRRAEAVARAAAQRSFDRDILITDVLILVSAQHESNIAPILSLEATRTQWRSLPDPHRWATYFRSSRRLLGLDRTPSSTATSAPSAPAPTTVTPVPAPPTPTSIPGQPARQPTGLPANSPNQPPPNGTGVTPTGSTGDTPGTPQPTRSPILPDRILTPAGIGK